MNRTSYWKIIGILIVVLLCHIPGVNYEFLNWDDGAHLTENVAVRSLSLDNIKRIFLSSVNRTYIPLTILSFAVEHHFFGLNPFVYHFHNILLHLAITFLVYLFVIKLNLGIPVACFAAFLFGLHPLGVDSIFWISERKDLLYSLFYLLSLINYLDYICYKTRKYFLFAMGFACFSLLSKPMALSLPLIFLLLDWVTKRGVNKRQILEKSPICIVFISIVWITLSKNLFIFTVHQSIGKSLLIFCWTSVFYIWKFLLPLNMAPFYSLPKPISLVNPSYQVAVLLFCFFIFVLIRLRKKRWLLFAFFYYVLSLFFLFRLHDRPDASWVANRFMYLPSLGFCVFLGTIYQYFISSRGGKSLWFKLAVNIICGVFGVSLAIQSHLYGKIYQNSITFWSYVINHTPQFSYEGFKRRAAAYITHNQYEKALYDINRVIAIRSYEPSGYTTRGFIFSRLEKKEEALKNFELALKIDPQFAVGHYNKGLIFQEKGKRDLALEAYNSAIETGQLFSGVYNERGKIYIKKNRPENAINDFDRAIAIDPLDPKGYINLGIAYDILKKFDLAIKYFSKAIELNPQSIEALTNRGIVYNRTQQYDLAIIEFSRALAIDPGCFQAYNGRANSHKKKLNLNKAIADFSRALDIHPRYVKAYNNRGKVYIQKKAFDLALADFDQAIQHDPYSYQAYYNKAVLSLWRNAFDEAIKNLDRAIDINPHYVKALFQRGEIRYYKKEYDSALEDFSKTIQLDPQFAKAYIYRSVIRQSKNSFSGALKDAQKAKELGLNFTDEYIEDLKSNKMAVKDYLDSFKIDFNQNKTAF